MPRVLDQRDSHSLVMLDNGETELVPRSPFNRLIYEHGLHDFLVDGSEIISYSGDHYDATLSKNDGDGNGYTLDLDHDDEAFSRSLTIPSREQRKLLDALLDVYASRTHDPQPLADLAAELLDFDVNPEYVNRLAALDVFSDKVELRSDGWLINDHVLLSYDNTFYHPDTNRASRSGEILDDAAELPAYELSFARRPSDSGQTALSGFAGFGGEEETVEFVSRALWAVTYTPEEL